MNVRLAWLISVVTFSKKTSNATQNTALNPKTNPKLMLFPLVCFKTSDLRSTDLLCGKATGSSTFKGSKHLSMIILFVVSNPERLSSFTAAAQGPACDVLILTEHYSWNND